jgi:dipeptidase E
MYVYSKTGFADMLPELLKSKVYVGSSAGSMVIGNRVSTESYQRIYGEGDTFGINKYLGFVDLAIKPHLNSSEWPNNRVEKLQEVSSSFSGTLYGLSDTSAITVNGEKVDVIGEDWVRIEKGKVL